MDCIRFTVEFVVLTVVVVTCSSCSYHQRRKRNYKIDLKAYINNLVIRFGFDN